MRPTQYKMQEIPFFWLRWKRQRNDCHSSAILNITSYLVLLWRKTNTSPRFIVWISRVCLTVQVARIEPPLSGANLFLMIPHLGFLPGQWEWELVPHTPHHLLFSLVLGEAACEERAMSPWFTFVCIQTSYLGIWTFSEHSGAKRVFLFKSAFAA